MNVSKCKFIYLSFWNIAPLTINLASILLHQDVQFRYHPIYEKRVAVKWHATLFTIIGVSMLLAP